MTYPWMCFVEGWELKEARARFMEVRKHFPKGMRRTTFKEFMGKDSFYHTPRFYDYTIYSLTRAENKKLLMLEHEHYRTLVAMWAAKRRPRKRKAKIKKLPKT